MATVMGRVDGTSEPKAILLDIGLPGTDGYEVAKRIRAMPCGASIRLIALSGYGQPEDRARAVRDGFDAHLVKPVTPDNIRKVLAAGAELQRLRD